MGMKLSCTGTAPAQESNSLQILKKQQDGTRQVLFSLSTNKDSCDLVWPTGRGSVAVQDQGHPTHIRVSVDGDRICVQGNPAINMCQWGFEPFNRVPGVLEVGDRFLVSDLKITPADMAILPELLRFSAQGSDSCPPGASPLAEPECEATFSAAAVAYPGGTTTWDRPLDRCDETPGCYVDNGGDTRFNRKNLDVCEPDINLGPDDTEYMVCKDASIPLAFSAQGSASCPPGAIPLSEQECEATFRSTAVGYPGGTTTWDRTVDRCDETPGCYVDNGGSTRFNRKNLDDCVPDEGLGPDDTEYRVCRKAEPF